MSKPKTGTYLFIHYGFGGEGLAPQLSLLAESADEFCYLQPRGHKVTLAFDTTQRFCSGWHDLATTESFPCPDKAAVQGAYHQCHHCQKKTGFNPAFYHAVHVSEQQAARNRLPHSIYLAHFGPGVVKVGMTWTERGLKRLLDQGARSCLMLNTYANANVARQYEAKIAKLPGIAETLQIRVKQKLLGRAYDHAAAKTELLTVRERLTNDLGFKSEPNQPIHLDTHYLDSHQLLPTKLVSLDNEQTISGHCIGMVGSTLLVEQDGTQFGLPLGKLIGHRVTLNYEQIPNQHQPQQITLF